MRLHKKDIWLLLLVLVIINSRSYAIDSEKLLTSLSDTVSQVSDSISRDSIKNTRKWTTNDSYISGAFEWTNQDDDKKLDFDLRFGANFTGRLDEIDVKLEADFSLKNGKQNTNDQNLRLNWYHKFNNKWYLMGQGRLERNQRTIADMEIDYVIWLGGMGPGYYFKTKNKGGSRISVLYNYLQLFVFTGDIEIHTKSPSLYLDNNYQLTEKLNLKNWTSILFYEWDDVGYELETELGYSITKHLTLGLRHYYLYNGPTLKHTESNELRLYTKITF